MYLVLMQFVSKIVQLDSNVWGRAIPVPSVVEIDPDHRRYMVKINDHEPFHGGAMPDGQGSWFYTLNKQQVKDFGLDIGDEVEVTLEKDLSRFGMPMPMEFEELFIQDVEGGGHFEKLTPGKQRNLIYIVNNVKNPDIKLRRALVIVDHLKSQNGKIDFKALNAEIKEANQKAKNMRS